MSSNNDGRIVVELFGVHLIREDILIPAIGKNIRAVLNGFNDFVEQCIRPYLLFSQANADASVASMYQNALDIYVTTNNINMTAMFREYLDDQLNSVPGLYDKLSKMYMGA